VPPKKKGKNRRKWRGAPRLANTLSTLALAPLIICEFCQSLKRGKGGVKEGEKISARETGERDVGKSDTKPLFITDVNRSKQPSGRGKEKRN